jgi:hypothetical protein
VSAPLVALTLQPEDEGAVVPSSPLTDGDTIIFAALVVIVAAVFGFDLLRTWWNTNQWRREARRRRRETS